jgi:hypothetical protein
MTNPEVPFTLLDVVAEDPRLVSIVEAAWSGRRISLRYMHVVAVGISETYGVDIPDIQLAFDKTLQRFEEEILNGERQLSWS